jgi:poly-gamma-glutamate synthesis protein (capsule biosynthesis protein)
MLFGSAPVHGDIVINAVGDIMLAGSAHPTLQREGFDYPFQKVARDLQRGDIAIGNLEAPLARRGNEFVGKKFRFKASPAAAPALKRAGFSILSLANNHILDYGDTALQETMDVLARQGVLTVGAGMDLDTARRVSIIEAKGKKVAFLAYSLTLPAEFFAARNRPGTAPAYPALFEADIRSARAMADYVIVSFHWGKEGVGKPTSTQVDFAHRAIDSGADVVIGHHPHVLQGVEQYRHGVIFYSLGNFVFGSMSKASDLGAIARITLDQGVKGVELIPVNVRNGEVRFQPRLLSGKARQKAITRMATLSRSVGGMLKDSDGICSLVMAPPFKEAQRRE